MEYAKNQQIVEIVQSRRDKDLDSLADKGEYEKTVDEVVVKDNVSITSSITNESLQSKPNLSEKICS